MRKATRLFFATAAIAGLALVEPGNPQQARSEVAKKPIQATVCQIWDAPWVFDNQWVSVRGYVAGGFETSVLVDSHCSNKSIWFQFADGSAAPELEAATQSTRPAYARTDERRLPVKLKRDANLELLFHYWEISAKGERCTENAPMNQLPDCTTYRVTATFIGRIDGVSKAIHMAHLKRPESPVDWKGFGHMGSFDAQIIAGAVEDVEAVENSW